MRISSGCGEWIGGRGFLFFHVLMTNEYTSECTPQSVVVEKTFYGMRMLYKFGYMAKSSARLVAFVFYSRERERCVIIVCPHLLLLSFMFALFALAVVVSIGALYSNGFLGFINFGIPTLIVSFLWLQYFQKFILENVYRGQRQYDQMCRQFIAVLRKPSSIRIVSMKRMGWLAIFANILWLFFSACCHRKLPK